MTLLNQSTSPHRLTPEFYERIWGATQLEPWFPNTEANIGEVWFRQPQSSVLVKFIFANENLSIQVHPDDALARLHGHSCGKTEMWHILRTAPDARIALGFNQPVTAPQIRQAATDGSIMDLLRWIPVHRGQTWFIPAGTVHAIGAGVTLCEVQQNSDVTYRLYDYGRGRELHLDRSLEALQLSDQPSAPSAEADHLKVGDGVIAECGYFHVTKLSSPAGLVQDPDRCLPASIVVILSGEGTLGDIPVQQGEVYQLPDQQQVAFTGAAELLKVLTRT